MSLTEEEKEALQDRFSGYQLPKVYLTAGFPSYDVPVHPYFFNQPLEWTKPAYTTYQSTGPQSIEGDYPVQPGPQEANKPQEVTGGVEISGSSGSSNVVIRSKKDDSENNGGTTDLLPL